MDAYHYHPRTKEFIQKRAVRMDPEEGNPLIPAHATKNPPPAEQKGHVRCYIDNRWVQIEDHRGERMFINRRPILITTLGVIDERFDRTLAEKSLPEKLKALREERDRRLFQTDWMLLEDAPLSPAEKTILLKYRKELRDLPSAVRGDNIPPFPLLPDVIKNKLRSR